MGETETVLEIERTENGKYVGAYFGEERDFMEFGHNELGVVLSLFHEQFTDNSPFVYPGTDGIVVRREVDTTIPYRQLAAVMSGEL